MLHWTVYRTLFNVFAENISKFLRHTSYIEDVLGGENKYLEPLQSERSEVSLWLRGETLTNQKEVQLSSLRNLGLP